MEEHIFNKHDIDYYISEHPKEKERLKNHNCIRIWVNGVEVMPDDTLEFIYYNDKEQE